MRTITTAAAFAIAASATSLAAGDGWTAGQDSGKSGKSGTKSSKGDGCTDCSADTLTRANTVTSLTYNTYGDDGVLNYDSLVDFCCDEEGQQTYLQAIEFTSGCLAYTNCLVGRVFNKLSDPDSNATVTEGAFLTASVNTLCLAEQTGVKQPAEVGCPNLALLCFNILQLDGACGGNPLA